MTKKCFRCGEEFEPKLGDVIIELPDGTKNYYHLKCWIDIEIGGTVAGD